MSNTMTTDSSVINKAVESLNDAPAATATINTVAPSDTQVSLPGGFITGEGTVVKYAEVRELNGMDEEAIAKASTGGSALMTILQRGLVKIGTETPSANDLDALLSGDREAILIGIRRATFGPAVKLDVTCTSCGERNSLEVDLVDNVDVVTLADPIADRTFKYTTKKGDVLSVKLPNGQVQKKLFDSTDLTIPELNTILISGCVLDINGVPTSGNSAALKLGIVDRRELVEQIVVRSPGPRLAEVTTTCAVCTKDIPVPLSLVDLFRL